MRYRQVESYLLVLPAFVALSLLLIGPALTVLGLSFTDYQLGASEVSFLGLGNYAELWDDRVFWISLRNTAMYVCIVTPGSICLALLFAVLVEGLKGSARNLFRTIYFLPVASTFVAVAVVWQMLMHPTLGFFNIVLAQLGIATIDFLGDPKTALLSLSVIGIWDSLGFNLIIFVAGLKAIPSDYYDAARVDGVASGWERFRRITWPLLGPTFLFVLVITLIRSIKVFEIVAVLTQGGPSRSTETIVYTIYTQSFSYARTGYGSALTVIFLVIVASVTLAKMTWLDRKVHYT